MLNFAEEAGSDLILSMESAEGEKVGLSPNLRARGPVEEWLSSVETDMVKTLKRELKSAYNDYEEEAHRRAAWTKEHAS